MPELNISNLYVRQGNTAGLTPTSGTSTTPTNPLVDIVTVTGIAFGSVLVAVLMGMFAGMVCCGMIYKYKMKKFVAERDQQETHRRRLYERQVHAVEAPEAAEPIKRHHGKKHVAFSHELPEIEEVDESYNDTSAIADNSRL